MDLTAFRSRKNIPLATISSATKIAARYLEAIERGHFAKLPGGVYNTSYIRQYARAIDFDEEELLASYYRETGCQTPATADERLEPPAPALSAPPRLLWNVSIRRLRKA
jgi:cytoskeletal protein RodZ